MAYRNLPASDLSEAAKQARREYKREWNRRNRDKVKAAERRYWERKAADSQEAKANEHETDQVQN